MAGRVNKKFVLMLAVALVALTAAVGAVLWIVDHRDPTALIAAGHELASRGQYEQACAQYSLALKKDPSNVSVILSYVDAAEKVTTPDVHKARRYLERMIDRLNQAIKQAPGNTAPFDRLMRLYLKIGRDLGDAMAWDRMYQRSQSMLAANPQLLLAGKYRGIATVNRMQALDTTPKDRDQARDDLEKHLQQNPDDADADFYLSWWHVLEARFQERPGGDPQLAVELRRKARSRSSDAIARHPDDPRRVLDYLRILASMNAAEESSRVAGQLESQLLAAMDQPDAAEHTELLRLVVGLADLLPVIDRDTSAAPQPQDLPPGSIQAQAPAAQPADAASADTAGPDAPAAAPGSGLKRAENLLRKAADLWHDDLRLSAALGQILSQQRRVNDAMNVFEVARHMLVRGSPIDALRNDRLQLFAAFQYANMMLTQIESQSDAKAREAALQQVETVAGEMASAAGEAPSVDLLRGRVAMLRGQWAQAASLLERANTQFRESNPEALRHLAQTCERIGELGAAADRLEQLLRLKPNYLRGRFDLARVYILLRQADRADRQLKILLEADPQNSAVRQLQAAVLALQGHREQAIQIYEKLDHDSDQDMTLPMAQLYLVNGETLTARSMLFTLVQRQPKNLRAWQMLLRTATSKEEALLYLDQARKAGADENAIRVMESRFTQGADITDALEAMLQQEPDPFQRQIQRYRLFSRMGKDNLANEALAAAAKLEPQHPIVVELMFAAALARKDWDTAERLASQAQTLDSDLAKGMFFRGRLAMARGELQQAATFFHQGVELRPVYSEGHRLLGDALHLNGELAEAQASYTKALLQRPNNVAALSGLASVQIMQRSYVSALNTLKTAVRFAPDDRRLLEQYLYFEERYGDAKAALAFRQRLAQLKPDFANNRRALIRLMARQKMTAEARAAAEALLSELGRSRANLAAAAQVYALTGEPDVGRKLLQDYVHSLGDKATSEDWVELARYLSSVGQDEACHSAYRQAIALQDAKTQPASRELADLLFRQRQFAQAAAVYQAIWKRQPDDKRVGQRLIESLLSGKQLDEAQVVLKAYTEQHGSDANTHMLLALSARNAGSLATAEAELKKAIEQAPQRPIAHSMLGELYLEDPAKESQAIECFQRALELDPNLIAPRMHMAELRLRRGEEDDAARLYEEILTRYPQNIEARQKLVELQVDRKQYLAARSVLDEAVKLYPHDPQWPRWQAAVARRDGKYNDSVKYLRQAMSLKPAPQTLSDLALLLAQLKRADDALAVLNEHKALVAESTVLQAIYARVLAQKQDTAGAVSTFTSALQQSATMQEASAVYLQMAKAFGRQATLDNLKAMVGGANGHRVRLLIARMMYEQKDYGAALASLRQVDRQALDKAGEQLLFDQLLSASLERTGAYEESVKVYQRILKATPDDVATLNNLAYLLAVNVNRAAEALPLAQRAVDLAPQDNQVLDTLGWVQFKVGQLVEAQRSLQKSVQREALASNCYHLAEVLLARNRSAEAIELFKRARGIAIEKNSTLFIEPAERRLRELGIVDGVKP